MVVLAHGYWVANWKTYGARQPSSPTLCLFVIGDFVWFGLREKIGNLVFFFFFITCCGLLVVVVVVGVIVADGRSGCDWCCGCFLDSEIYYFIVVVILFYCNVYIILLC